MLYMYCIKHEYKIENLFPLFSLSNNMETWPSLVPGCCMGDMTIDEGFCLSIKTLIYPVSYVLVQEPKSVSRGAPLPPNFC